MLPGTIYARSSASNTVPGLSFSAASRGETHQASQHLLAALHDWLAGLNYQARSVLALIRGVVAALARSIDTGTARHQSDQSGVHHPGQAQ